MYGRKPSILSTWRGLPPSPLHPPVALPIILQPFLDSSALSSKMHIRTVAKSATRGAGHRNRHMAALKIHSNKLIWRCRLHRSVPPGACTKQGLRFVRFEGSIISASCCCLAGVHTCSTEHFSERPGSIVRRLDISSVSKTPHSEWPRFLLHGGMRESTSLPTTGENV